MVSLSRCLRSATNLFNQENANLASVAKRLIAVEQCGPDHFQQVYQIFFNAKQLCRAKTLLQGRMSIDPVYGGQDVALLLRSGCVTVPDNMLPHSTHTYFLKSPSVNQPLNMNVRRVRDGRSFCTRYVEASQNGDVAACAVASFHTNEKAAIRHEQRIEMKQRPDGLLSWEDALNDALSDPTSMLTPLHRTLLEWKLKETPRFFHELFDIRACDNVHWTLRKRRPTHEAPKHEVFMKCRYSPGSSQVDHRVMASFMGDMVLMECALVDHMSSGFYPSMLFSLDQCVYFHNDIQADEWMFCQAISPVAEGGRAYAECKFWRPDGRLLMTSTQEGIVRYHPSHPSSQLPK